ncbi:MAG: hypothetical protein WC788_00245 [Candidatus Paceibacterota bacterium]|jgi:flagellar motility protein MotE (MotC chaperone)
MEDRIPSEIGAGTGDEKIEKKDAKTKWVYPKAPEHESELDKVIAKMTEEMKIAEKQRLEEEEKRRDEAYKDAIEKISKAFVAGKPERARKILEELVETEGAKIAMELSSKRQYQYSGCGRPSHTIFFRKGS